MCVYECVCVCACVCALPFITITAFGNSCTWAHDVQIIADAIGFRCQIRILSFLSVLYTPIGEINT